MQADAVKALVELGRQAAGTKFHKCPQEPEHVYHVVDEQGRFAKVAASPPPHSHDCYDVAAVAAKAVEWIEVDDAEVWYSRQAAVAASARDRATLHLTYSRPFQVLSQWEAGASLKQADLIHHLRVTFAGCLPAHPGLLPAVRKVDIRKVQEATGDVQRAKVSMGRSLVAEASGASDLPEVVAFDVPVFAEAAVPHVARVKAAFDLDPQAEAFRVYVLPGEVERAAAEAEERLYGLIVHELGELGEPGAAVKVFYGEP